ncbi:unnamed protein product, partial [Amoebophrya sp. A120]
LKFECSDEWLCLPTTPLPATGAYDSSVLLAKPAFAADGWQAKPSRAGPASGRLYQVAGLRGRGEDVDRAARASASAWRMKDMKEKLFYLLKQVGGRPTSSSAACGFGPQRSSPPAVRLQTNPGFGLRGSTLAAPGAACSGSQGGGVPAAAASTTRSIPFAGLGRISVGSVIGVATRRPAPRTSSETIIFSPRQAPSERFRGRRAAPRAGPGGASSRWCGREWDGPARGPAQRPGGSAAIWARPANWLAPERATTAPRTCLG